ncbi:MAG: XRE family transcriptional regulator [Bdellovibrionales bacterium]|nr:XRE family transcriptional regulator [Bdellovibrionales bacterium]
MKLNKRAKELASDLNLNDAEAAVMELKAQLYQQAAKSIAKSTLTHAEIAIRIGTSRARVTRIANLGENSLSMELLIKIITTLTNKIPLRVA